MGVYRRDDEEKISNEYWFQQALQDKKSSIKVPEGYIEEASEEEAPTKKYLSDLRNDEQFIQKAQPYIDYMQNQVGFFDAVIEAGNETNRYKRKKTREPKKESPVDIIEMLRDEDNKLPTLFSTAVALEEAPKEVIESYLETRKAFEDSEINSFVEYMRAAKDFTGDIITDPVNFLGLLSIPFIGGTAAAARSGAKEMAKREVQKNIRSKLQALATPTKVTALEAGAFTGLYDYGVQTRNIATEVQEEFDIPSLAVNTAVGATVGAVLGKGIDLGISKLQKKYIEKSADPNYVETKDLIENDALIGELVDSEGIEYSKDRLGLDDDTADFIEGVFEVIDDEEKVVAAVNKYARKKGLSEEARDELAAKIASREDPIQSQGAIASAVSKVINISRQAPAIYGGRVSTLLDPYTGKSDTVKALQNKFRYDANRTFFGERTLEGQDYAEVLSDTLGDYYVRMKTALDPVLRQAGFRKDEMYLELSNAVRGKPSENEVINKAASSIRADLDRAAQELKDLGLYDEAKLITENYFPRVWNRKAIENNQSEFMSLLVRSGEANSEEEARSILGSMLSKKDDYGESTGNFFLSNRAFNKISDDTMFEKFLDNDTQNVLLTYYNQVSKQMARQKVFGATRWDDFSSIYRNQIIEELGEVQGKKALRDLETVWNAQTGEGKGAHKFQNVVDGVTTAQRFALLPLATLSSLTEIFLNLSRGGVYTTVKGFSKAIKDGTKTLTYDMVDALVKNHNLSRPEAFRKMQRFGVALDQAASDQVERLSGESIRNPFLAKANRAFFRANLLEPWTKTVQLTSFNVGRDIIIDNLKVLAKYGAKKPNKTMQRKIDELLELNIDISKGIQWIKETGGDLEIDNAFTYQVDRGASRYTNEIILNPTMESGMRSLALSTNPFTTMLFQLTSYPAAFTNTILKDMVRRTARGVSRLDAVGAGKVMGTALVLQGVASQLNYARNAVFTQDPDYKYKSPEKLQIEALARWGGNGLYLDIAQRASRASEFIGPEAAFITAPFGPTVQDLTTGLVHRSLATTAATKAVPFYGALPQETKKEIRSAIKNSLKSKKEERYIYAKGGEVLDVPNAPIEPDQRIDKMTGQPYDKQAGTAFVDEEDPLRRLGFGLGSLVTRVGRKVYHDEEGQPYSEKTETIQLDDGRWVNYPTIDKEGKKIPERLFKKLVESQATKEGVVDFITGEVLPTFKDKEEAIEQAAKRSESLLEE